MSRIAKLPFEEWNESLRLNWGSEPTQVELGASQITAHHPPMALALGAFGRALRDERTLPERLMELVRLRIAFFNQCRTCMAVRYASAVADGLDEGAVCSLDRPEEAANLREEEKAAIAYGEAMATDHLAINDAMYNRLKLHFSEAEIVELGMWCAFCIGFGRLTATWDLTEDLPAAFRDLSGAVAPSAGVPVTVNRTAPKKA
jgi:AhpD family alkylhydroperoxidase